MITIRLSDAQQAALECRDWTEVTDDVVLDAWDGDRLYVTNETREALWDAIVEASNAEDADADQNQDRTMAGFAGRASRSLSAIAGKVLNARPGAIKRKPKP